MLKYLTNEEVIEHFGDPRSLMRDDGSISPLWEIKILASFKLPAPLPYVGDNSVLIKSVRCHKLILPFMEAAFTELFADQEVWSTLGDFGGCYNWRLQRNSKVISRHAFGLAVDLDVKDNPMGGVGNVHPRTIEIFENNGFIWGGRFKGKRIDPMHYDFADLARLG